MFKWGRLGRAGRGSNVMEAPPSNHAPPLHFDVRITSGSNGYVITSLGRNYDEKDTVYIAKTEDELCETIVLALVNRKIAAR